MDPSQAAQDIFEQVMMRQWFVAAVLLMDIVFLVIAFVWLLKRQDKRDSEIKDVVHHYYNALGANTLSNHALAEGVKDVASELADLRRAVDRGSNDI